MVRDAKTSIVEPRTPSTLAPTSPAMSHASSWPSDSPARSRSSSEASCMRPEMLKSGPGGCPYEVPVDTAHADSSPNEFARAACGMVRNVFCMLCVVVLAVGTTSMRFDSSRVVVVFECVGGTDKVANGHRADTMFLFQALIQKGFAAQHRFYTDLMSDDLLQELVGPWAPLKPTAYISRVDPGEYEHCSMPKYYEFLRRLVDAGVTPFNHPDDMEALGDKMSLLRLQGLPFFVEDTNHYFGRDTGNFVPAFSRSLQRSRSRVVKQNKGSKGEGIWWVSLDDASENIVTNSTVLQVVEAANEDRFRMTLQEFSEIVAKYLDKVDGGLLDMPFLTRIVEGEVRLVVKGRKVIHVVEKQPRASKKNMSFSASLGAGARHIWHTPDKFPEVVERFSEYMDETLSRMGITSAPPLWTADFIRAGPSEETQFMLSEINGNCVGFKSFPHLAFDLVSSVDESLAGASKVS